MIYNCSYFDFELRKASFVDVDFTPNPKLSARVLNKIQQTTLENKGLVPDLSDEYICATCKNPGISHPVTSFCFVCGDDNWSAKEGVLTL